MTETGRRNRYTPEQKEDALALLRDDGNTLYDVQRQTGVPVSTLHDWAASAGLTGRSGQKAQAVSAATQVRTARIAAKRSVLAEQMLDKATELLARIDEPHYIYAGKDATKREFEEGAPAGDVRNYVVSVGVLVDKFRLEMGEATEITKRLHPARKLDEKLDELRMRRERKEQEAPAAEQAG